MRIHPFFRRFGMIASGLGLVIVFSAITILNAANEWFSMRDVSVSSDDLLVGSAFNQNTVCYKVTRAKYLRPELVYLGSSRVMQFRDVMTPGVQSYNLGGSASSLATALVSLSSLFEAVKPKVVVLGIDTWWFDPKRAVSSNADRLSTCFKNELSSTLANLSARLLEPRFWSALVDGKVNHDTDPLAGRKPRGFLAGVFGSGFRPDGSYQYGQIVQNTDPNYDRRGFGYRNGFRYYVSQAKRERGRLGYTGPIEQKQVEELRELIALSKRHGVRLVLILPPFAHAVFGTMQNIPNHADFLNRMKKLVTAEARAGEVELYDFHDLATIGIDDRHTFDGIHADEVAHMEMVRRMASGSSVLAKLIDRDALTEMVKQASDKNRRFHFNLVAR